MAEFKQRSISLDSAMAADTLVALFGAILKQTQATTCHEQAAPLSLTTTTTSMTMTTTTSVAASAPSKTVGHSASKTMAVSWAKPTTSFTMLNVMEPHLSRVLMATDRKAAQGLYCKALKGLSTFGCRYTFHHIPEQPHLCIVQYCGKTGKPLTVAHVVAVKGTIGTQVQAAIDAAHSSHVVAATIRAKVIAIVRSFWGNGA